MREDKIFVETRFEKRMYMMDTQGNITQILRKRRRKPFNIKRYFIKQLSWKNVCLDVGIKYIDFNLLNHEWDDEDTKDDDLDELEDEEEYDYDE